MLARIQQFTTFGLLVLALGWAALFIRNGSPRLAVIGALLIVFGYALFLAAEFVMLWRVNRNDPTPRATVWQHVVAWWGEVMMAPRVFCWRQPFRSQAVPDFLPTGTRRRGIVFVHGFVCNRGLWNPHMRRLRELGVPFVSVSLEPVFGSIDAYPPVIDHAVKQLESATGLAPVIVAHSMGGLASRAWLDAFQSDARVHRIITIGTPHHGTYLGHWAMAPNAKQMNLGSDWQKRLASREPSARYTRFTCFYGHCDNIVFPAITATLPGADNRHLAGIAHVHMAHHDDVFKEALRWVGSSSTGAAGTEAGATLAR
jgi:pimeloyl-ACP methyl ester carboxylesterase